jgi:hypothetical protein
MKFKDYRKLAAAMDVRIRQLTADGIHGAAVIDHMVSHLSDLQRIWVGTSDAELLRLTEEFPGFYEYASLMEEAAEAERQKPSRSYDGLLELPNALKEMISALLSTAAVLERRYRAAVRYDIERYRVMNSGTFEEFAFGLRCSQILVALIRHVADKKLNSRRSLTCGPGGVRRGYLAPVSTPTRSIPC